MATLTKDQILDAADLPVLEVPVPEWGDGATVFVRTLTAEENERLQEISKGDDADADAKFLGRFAALVICDADGGRLFENNEAWLLGRKSLAVLGRIMEAAQEHNGMTAAARETSEKNSEPSRD